MRLHKTIYCLTCQAVLAVIKGDVRHLSPLVTERRPHLYELLDNVILSRAFATAERELELLK